MAKKPKVSNYKICSKCHKELPVADYYKDGTGKDGPRYRNECKSCYREIRKERDLAKTLPYVERTTPVIHIGDDSNDKA